MADIAADQARVNITHGGNNGDLPDPVSFDATDADVKAWVTEAVRGGGIPGIPANPNANFADFVVDRFAATGDLPNRISVRPKTPFGGELDKKSWVYATGALLFVFALGLLGLVAR